MQLVTIVGEPGVGKSRLVGSCSTIWGRAGATRWRQGRCLPYGEGIALLGAGGGRQGPGGNPRVRLSGGGDREAHAAVSRTSPSDSGWCSGSRRWSGCRRRVGGAAGVVHGLAALPGGVAAARQTVLVFEDLHWADDALLEFLDFWPRVGEVPMLLLCTARPELYEGRPGWGGGSETHRRSAFRHSPIQDTVELVSHLIEPHAAQRGA